MPFELCGRRAKGDGESAKAKDLKNLSKGTLYSIAKVAHATTTLSIGMHLRPPVPYGSDRALVGSRLASMGRTPTTPFKRLPLGCPTGPMAEASVRHREGLIAWA